eukprot:2324405-Prymnesium_polylepis.1
MDFARALPRIAPLKPKAAATSSTAPPAARAMISTRPTELPPPGVSCVWGPEPPSTSSPSCSASDAQVAPTGAVHCATSRP